MFALFRCSAFGLAGVALLAAACSPALNWREMRPEGAALLALMPCKPESATREVPLLGLPTELHMHSCEASGMTFAVAWAELADAGRAPEALEQWQAASLTAVRAVPGAGSVWTVALDGATSQRGVKAQGRDHQGKALSTQAAYFARGNKVYQGAIYGPQVGAEASATFFDGLSLQ